MRAAALGLAAVLATGGARAAPADAQAAAPPSLHLVVSGLREPVFAVAAPARPDRLYVVERAGLIRIVERGRILPRPFADLRRHVRSGGLRGLFSLAFHPRYLRTRRAFVNYVGRDGDIHVDELRVRRGYAAGRRELLRVPAARRDAYGHYGGQVLFGPDGGLYAAFGDTSDPVSAQDPQSLRGKLVRIRVDGSAEPQLVAVGLRNPWRMSFDRRTGDLYVGDVGESRREEIDVVPRAARRPLNFGWDVFEGTLRRGPVPDGLAGRLTPPLLEYAHRGGCRSVVGGFVYRGRDLRRLRGRYVFGDVCGGVWSVAVGGGRASARRAEPFVPPGRLVSFAEDAQGELLLVTLDGAVYALR